MEFRENDILTKEMLQQMYDDPFIHNTCRFQHVNTGVISGMSVLGDRDGAAGIGKGVMAVCGKLYIHQEVYELDASSLGLEPDQRYVVYLKKALDKLGRVSYEFQVEEDRKQKDQLIFLRFRYDGDKIFRLPGRLEEVLNENAYVNLLSMPYCNAYGIFVCPPVVSRCILETLKEKESPTVQEFCIMSEIFNTGTVSIEMLYEYMGRNRSREEKLNLQEVERLLNTIKGKRREKEMAVKPEKAKSEVRGSRRIN